MCVPPRAGANRASSTTSKGLGSARGELIFAWMLDALKQTGEALWGADAVVLRDRKFRDVVGMGATPRLIPLGVASRPCWLNWEPPNKGARLLTSASVREV